ncbi:MAG: sugar ABC transporter substrate-binding protein [Acidobacteria bacterium]|nr:MAG: sugar ABC transporter substrate-binding protein [Acidobacteriota bacterium]
MPAAVQGVPGRIGVAAGVMMRRSLVLAAVAALLLGRETIGLAQDSQYVIGPDDVLSVVFWRDKDMSQDVVVRPDGKISLPLVNDVQAGGLTPSQLRDSIKDAARRFVEDPSVTVVVKQINSRKVFITGQIEKPGPYPINGPTSVVQLISLAILIMRTDKAGRKVARPFNYHEVLAGKNLEQNIDLEPGDTVVVP